MNVAGRASADSSEASTRSAHWFGASGKLGVVHRFGVQAAGFPARVLDGRPVIGICNSWSELVPCNAHLRDVAQAVKNGVWEAGGVPLEFPSMSLGEQFLRPTSMLFRNLASMEVEETLRANPLDGVVLLAGCDKTTAALLMGAASTDLPTIVVTGGPMSNGRFRGRDVGAGTDIWRFSDAVRTGAMLETEMRAAEVCMARTSGHCNTMGTASTMAVIAETLGLQLHGTAAIPAVDARHRLMAHEAGRRSVDLVRQDLRLSHIVTAASLRNAVRVLAAIGGSTNAVLHLLALAGRLELALTLDDIDDFGASTPLLVDVMPAGTRLMEDFAHAGGTASLLRAMRPLLDVDVATVDGVSLGTLLDRVPDAAAPLHSEQDIIHTLDNPLMTDSSIAVLHGSLCPNGAVVKRAAASPDLSVHTGPALVFNSIEAYRARCDDPHFEVDPSAVLVLRNSGPIGYPGMPEVGSLPLPRSVLARGVKDMVRISDARMSGTSYGTIVLHVAPESAVGGPLALLCDGDIVELDVPGRRLDVRLSAAEMADRQQRLQPLTFADRNRGYVLLYTDHVLQADEGADFDFLRGRSGSAVPRQLTS